MAVENCFHPNKHGTKIELTGSEQINVAVARQLREKRFGTAFARFCCEIEYFSRRKYIKNKW
jgi:hypothetical protein